jgi:hypothetical protein
MMARDDGVSSAAPMPSMTASPAMSIGTFEASDAMNEPMPNSAAPASIRRLGPYMSPSRPPMTSKLA